jgi:PTH1 family peptidyl-tRNA hydrolase
MLDDPRSARQAPASARTGSSGGHNGLQSIIEHFGTGHRGCRHRHGSGGRCRGARARAFASVQSLDRALEAIDYAQTRGFDAAMNAYN